MTPAHLRPHASRVSLSVTRESSFLVIPPASSMESPCFLLSALALSCRRYLRAMAGHRRLAADLPVGRQDGRDRVKTGDAYPFCGRAVQARRQTHARGPTGHRCKRLRHSADDAATR